MFIKVAAVAVVASVLGWTTPLVADEPATPMIAQGCAGCHGQSGAGEGAVPQIAGFDRAEFLQTWDAIRAGERPATIMTRIARGYTDDEVATLADYFSSLEAQQ